VGVRFRTQKRILEIVYVSKRSVLDPHSGSSFGMEIRIQATNLMQIHADLDSDPDPKHWIKR
jgi:hypothetical protein